LTGDVRGPADVLVGRVRARPHQRVRDVERVALLGRDPDQLIEGPVEIRGVRPDDVRLEIVEIDLDDTVIEALRVGLDLGVAPEELGVLVGEAADRVPPRGLQILRRADVIGEQRARGADLSPHVADRGLPGRRDRLDQDSGRRLTTEAV